MNNELVIQKKICGKCHKTRNGSKDLQIIAGGLKLIEEKCICGRPKTYGDDILNKAREYLELCIDTVEDKDNGIRKKVRLPSIGGMAVYLGVSRDILRTWDIEHVEFSVIMEELRSMQEQRLIDNGLSSDYNPTIAKVLLTKHGYIDKSDVTSDGKPLEGNKIMFAKFIDNKQIDDQNS